MALKSGDVLHNRYRVVKLLAQGGFGTLYRTWDTSLGRPCVLKENLIASPDAQRQFLREAKILANLSHPNLPRVTDYFLDKTNAQYLVMDYVEGQDLQQMLEERGGPFSEQQAVEWAIQICEALAYLHSQAPPIIHRDVKPANIRITPTGKAILVDFGIAKVFDPGAKTTVGAQAVSPGYSPVEQYGKGKTDRRTDIYALGATLYTMLTGEEPPESIQRVVSDPLVPPRQINASLSLRISSALVRAMQIDPSQRFQNAGEFKLAITPPAPVKLHQPSPQAYQAPTPSFAQKPAGKTLPWVWIGLVSLLLAIIAGLLLLLSGGNTERASGTSPASQTAMAGGAVLSTPQASPSQGWIASPSATTVAREPTLTPLVYMVQLGDTCSEIAEAYGLSVREIVGSNADLAPDCGVLFAGQPLVIPQPRGPIATPAFIRSPTARLAMVTQIASTDGMTLVAIPAGEFKMGAGETDPQAGESEKPQHIVFLSAYWIDLSEVSNAMYRRCVEQSSCRPPEPGSSKTRQDYFENPAFDDYPVVHVRWSDAQDYCRWVGRRLPSEAEWEKAARGTDGRIYPWGNQFPGGRLANFGGLSGDTERVGSYPLGRSPYGVLDLAGNVSEWVADLYNPSYYGASVYKDPRGPQEGEFHLIRGGSWFSSADALRTTFRLWNYPDLRSETIGFRCAK